MNINSSLSHRSQEPEKSVLYIVATPIGNLNDISKRAINILEKTSLILCEDTRTTLKLLNFLKISNKLISFNNHNALNKIPSIITKLSDGNSIALVSEAGTPLISDPGELLVKKIRERNFDVIAIPGPCAAISALVTSGLKSSKFVFYGFVPKSSKERKNILNSIKANRYTSIIYESPLRIRRLLFDLKEICGEKRKISISRELTKKFEQQIGNNISEVISYFEMNTPKGELTIILDGNEEKGNNDNEFYKLIKFELLELIGAGLSHSVASVYLSKKYKRPKNKIYKLLFSNNGN